MLYGTLVLVSLNILVVHYASFKLHTCIRIFLFKNGNIILRTWIYVLFFIYGFTFLKGRQRDRPLEMAVPSPVAG